MLEKLIRRVKLLTKPIKKIVNETREYIRERIANEKNFNLKGLFTKGETKLNFDRSRKRKIKKKKRTHWSWKLFKMDLLSRVSTSFTDTLSTNLRSKRRKGLTFTR